MTVPEPAARSPKAEQTRRAIVDSAMRLFRDKGYGKTTMRAIASEAGVSLGNAYYYFGSKEHLIQAFYDQMQEQHAEAAGAVLARETTFARRLEGVLLAWLDVAEPSHEFAGQFFKNAADPASPLSPFSLESAPARDASIALFGSLVEGADLKLAPTLRQELPQLLWLMQMGVVLFWVYDASPGQARSRMLVSRIVPVVDRLTRLSRLPVVRGVVDDVVSLVGALRS
ncbi:MAG: hypothetical protein JWN91_2045 [Nocardioides sp.]|nr:hypothetical protein [Nocardioides sp.]